jgi:hypothetical protein
MTAPLYDSPEKLQKAIDLYFSLCRKDETIPLLTELTYELGFADRTSLREQANRGKEYSHIVKRAKARCEIAQEKILQSGACTGAIFNLKCNYGWQDKTVIESKGEHVIKRLDLTDAERSRLLREMAEARDGIGD